MKINDEFKLFRFQIKELNLGEMKFSRPYYIKKHTLAETLDSGWDGLELYMESFKFKITDDMGECWECVNIGWSEVSRDY